MLWSKGVREFVKAARLFAADSPGCRDVVVDGTAGVLCAPKDSRSLAGAMLRLLEDPVLRTLRGIMPVAACRAPAEAEGRAPPYRS